MTLSLERLPWYGQLAAFVAIALGGVGVFWYFYAQSAQADLDVRQQQLATLRTEITNGLATARRLPEFRRDVGMLGGQLDQLRVVLPEERDVSDLLRRVQAMATQSNLTIRGFSPQPITTRELHAEWPIGLELEGTYHNLGMFLERVSKFPRVINVTGLSIRPQEDSAAGGTIVASCTATTFVMSEPAQAAPEPAGRGRARARAGRGGGARG